MLPNSSQFLCNSGGILAPFSHPFSLNSAPYNITRRSKTSFLICDNNVQQNKVDIFDMDISGQKAVHLDFQNFNATRWDSFDDNILMINSEGDIVYVNLNNKCIDVMKKQHPGESVCVLHSENEFITAGGYVKSLDKDQSQRIIKIWAIDNDDKLVCKSRFNTGHTRPVQNAMMMNRNIVVTLSKDRSIRLSDINFEATTRVIYTPSEEPLSACQLSHHTMVYGGNRPYLNMIDTRSRKDIRERIALNEPLTQVTKIVRFSESQLMLCNVNNLMILDLNTLKIREKKVAEGETIWALKVLNENHFVIGNRGKFAQVWEVFKQ